MGAGAGDGGGSAHDMSCAAVSFDEIDGATLESARSADYRCA